MVFLGSSSFIVVNKVVKEIFEGILDDGLVFEECFEFEGRFKVYFGFWVYVLGVNDFIFWVIDKGYVIFFIIFF